MDRQKVREIKNLLKELSKESGRGFSFYGSVISNEVKEDCRIYLKNDLEMKE